MIMSIFSDHSVGALFDEDFERECRRMNRRDDIEREELDGLNFDFVAVDDWLDEDSEGGLIADD